MTDTWWAPLDTVTVRPPTYRLGAVVAGLAYPKPMAIDMHHNTIGVPRAAAAPAATGVLNIAITALVSFPQPRKAYRS
jgi:hypothetical protein